MRCSRCGNENPETNRFCGMCGATLLQAPATVAASQSTAAQSAKTAASTAATRPEATVSGQPAASPRPAAAAEGPLISGPSFLGLNEPAPGKRASLSIDPNAPPGSRNLDYLLEDDEEPKGGWGKYILMLVALVLAVGLGYLRWQNQGFGWLVSGGHKASAAGQTAQGTDSSVATNAPASPANAAPTLTASQPAAAPQPTTTQPSTGTVAQPGANPAVAPAAAGASPAPGGAAAQPAAAPAAEDAGSSQGAVLTPAPSPASSSAITAAPTPAASAPATSSATSPATADTNAAATTPPAASDTSKPAADSKPSASLKPAKPFDAVSEAQKYIYGRGVSQDCARGMRLLKPAAEQSNPRAMIEMGALYSAGLCTPHDLPTAYRWFALALRKDPNNQSVQEDLQKLWGEMTQPERQLAIKLSQ